MAKDKVAFCSDNNDDGCGTARSTGGVCIAAGNEAEINWIRDYETLILPS